MDEDDCKEIEIKVESKFPHEEYFKQQLLDWEEERRQAKLAAEAEAKRLAEEEAARIEAEKQAERERREAEGLPPLEEEDKIEEQPAEQEGGLQVKEGDEKLQSRESKARPSTTQEEEDMEYVEEKVKYDFRPSDQFGYLSIVEEPTNRNWKYQYESKDEKLPSDTTWPFFDFTHQYANTTPLKILVLSKPKSGRSVYCQHLCDKLNLELITIDRPFKDIIKKIKKNLDDPQLDENDQPIEFLTPSERGIWDSL